MESLLTSQTATIQAGFISQNVPHRCGDGGIGGEVEGRSNKEALSVKVLAPAWPFSPRVVLAVFIVPSQSTQVYLKRKLEAFSVHHHDWDTGLRRAREDERTEYKVGMHQAYLNLCKQDFYSLGCNILRAWSESTTGNSPKEGIMGIIGSMLTADGQQFIVLRKPSIIIAQTAVWTGINIQLFLEPWKDLNDHQSK